MMNSCSAPDVDYQTRDYEGYRHLLLSLLTRSGTPWTERAAADLGVMLVEILANQLDHLSYAGDRVAEESHLASARSRESIRRHAALGDYRLDRGCGTSGYQHFELRVGERTLLRAGMTVSPPLAVGQDPERRLLVQTTEDAELDARRNRFTLERSAISGRRILHLLAQDGSVIDLRAIGVSSGMRLAICDGSQRELVAIVRVYGGAVQLADRLQGTYLAAKDSAVQVLGNLVPIRSGRLSDWEFAGHGGLELSEASTSLFFQGRLEQARQLRVEVESARVIWGSDPLLVDWWELANAHIEAALRLLRMTKPSTLSQVQTRDIDQRLTAATQLFRELIKASGGSVTEELQPTRRVTVPGQEIVLGGDDPTVWHDGANSLSVKVVVGGRWSAWTEVEDFLQSRVDDRHYVVQSESDGRTTLQFGDGVNGARLPADGQVMIRRVTGDASGGNLGADALTTVVRRSGDEFDLFTTTNPLPTRGARPSEPVDDLALRIAQALQIAAVPVTKSDYKQVLEKRADVAEAFVRVTKRGQSSSSGAKSELGSSEERDTRVLPRSDIAATVAQAAKCRVEVVIRPDPNQDAMSVLHAVDDYVEGARLCGSDVWVRLAEPLFVSIALVVEIHPEIQVSDLRIRLRKKLVETFSLERERLLGCERSLAEVYAAVESVPGVVWSQVLGFDRANQTEPTVQERIVSQPHQIVRCLDLPEQTPTGTIVIWMARRYRLQIELAYADPDNRPQIAELIAKIRTQLAGPQSVPVRDGWDEIVAFRVNVTLSGISASSGGVYQLRVIALMVGQRLVDRVPLLSGELPVLDDVQIRDKHLSAHYRLEVEIVLDPSIQLASNDELRVRAECHLRKILAGPESVPATGAPSNGPWQEITIDALARLLAERRGQLARALGVSIVVIRVLALIESKSGMDRVSLQCGEVPILDSLHVAIRREP